ncbi:hypothetical protein R5R35_005870 [Gryllus longicercus]|uniref:Adenine phosphoribosyltransferase n=1 Tax=Gryllus longicercus TaxID=2509291 RepID=A0AAN9VGF1_9ORTH
MGRESDINIVKNSIESYPDFPKPGVLFRDIFSLMKNPKALEALNKLILEEVENMVPKPDVIIGLESRGFLFGPLISLQTRIPFVPIRKKGKLPGQVNKQTYELEYGTDTVEIQSDAIQQGQNILIVDDLLATGGTLQAACKLVSQLGAHVKKCIVVMELLDLNGRRSVDAPIHSIVQY